MTVRSRNEPAGEKLLGWSLASMNRASSTKEKECTQYQSVAVGVDILICLTTMNALSYDDEVNPRSVLDRADGQLPRSRLGGKLTR